MSDDETESSEETDGTDAGSFLSQVQAFHSDDGCEVTGTAYTR